MSISFIWRLVFLKKSSHQCSCGDFLKKVASCGTLHSEYQEISPVLPYSTVVESQIIESVTRLDTNQQHSTPKAKRVVATVAAQKDWFDTLDDEETKDKRALVYDVTTPKQQVEPLTQF